MDIVACFFNENKLVWYENINGIGLFSIPILIDDTRQSPRSTRSIDINNDGFIDILTSYLPGNLVWYENNNGLGTFLSHVIESNNQDFYDVYTADIDNDGYNDVILSSDYYLRWFKNINGEGNFEPGIIIDSSGSSGSITKPFTADFDGDNDLDILVKRWSEPQHNLLRWHENTNGLGDFGNVYTIESNTSNLSYYSTFASDIDGDGDIDALASVNGKINWYENNLILANPNNNRKSIQIFPNPTSKFLYFNEQANVEEIIIYNSLGQNVYKANYTPKIDVSKLSRGIYLIHLKNKSETVEIKKFIKN